MSLVSIEFFIFLAITGIIYFVVPKKMQWKILLIANYIFYILAESLPIKIIAVQDRNKHNYPVYAYGVCKVFILCENKGGEFKTNIETTECKYFSVDNLPELALEKNTAEQIKMCFASNNTDKWEPLFD